MEVADVLLHLLQRSGRRRNAAKQAEKKLSAPFFFFFVSVGGMRESERIREEEDMVRNRSVYT